MNRSFEDLVAIGRVVKPQGRKGEVLTEPLSDRPDRFPLLKSAYVAGPGGTAREVVVTSCWPHKGRFVLKLEGVDTISDAEGYRGLEIRIGEEELPPLGEGAYYHHELLGCEVVDGEGRSLGAVEKLLETGGAPVLVVRGEKETLVPFAEPFIQSIDRGSRRVVVKPQEWVDAQD